MVSEDGWGGGGGRTGQEAEGPMAEEDRGDPGSTGSPVVLQALRSLLLHLTRSVLEKQVLFRDRPFPHGVKIDGVLLSLP